MSELNVELGQVFKDLHKEKAKYAELAKHKSGGGGREKEFIDKISQLEKEISDKANIVNSNRVMVIQIKKLQDKLSTLKGGIPAESPKRSDSPTRSAELEAEIQTAKEHYNVLKMHFDNLVAKYENDMSKANDEISMLNDQNIRGQAGYERLLEISKTNIDDTNAKLNSLSVQILARDQRILELVKQLDDQRVAVEEQLKHGNEEAERQKTVAAKLSRKVTLLEEAYIRGASPEKREDIQRSKKRISQNLVDFSPRPISETGERRPFVVPFRKAKGKKK